MFRILVIVVGVVIAGLWFVSLLPDLPVTKANFLSYNECVAWKMENRPPRDDAEVSRVIHCHRIMKMYLTRILEHGEAYAKQEDERRSYYIK